MAPKSKLTNAAQSRRRCLIDLLLLELLLIDSAFSQLDLEPGPLFGGVVQAPPRVGQLRLIQGFQRGYLPALIFFPLVNLQVKHFVFGLQTADLVDVDGQAIVEVAELLLFLQSGYPGGTQRCAAAAAARASLAGGSRGNGRHCVSLNKRYPECDNKNGLLAAQAKTEINIWAPQTAGTSVN